jgi:hypothetical protein
MRTSEPLAAATDLPSDARSATAARAFVRDVLSGSRLESVLDAAELCVSELVTNALLHAGTPMRLEVAPAGSGSGSASTTARTPSRRWRGTRAPPRPAAASP